MKKHPQYAERQKRDHVNLKEKEYAIYAAKAKIEDASISDLGNVSDTPPTAGQALVYNSVTNIWEPGDQTGGGGSTLPTLDQIIDRFPLMLAEETLPPAPSTAISVLAISFIGF